MEAGLSRITQKWPNHVALVSTALKPVWVFSRHGLSQAEQEQLSRDYTDSLGSELISVVISIKMMHVYFSRGGKTFDYRPHRGPFSGITVSPYRLGQTDRAECVLNLSALELKALGEYIENIRRSPAQVLGTPHGLSLTEPDFTVLSHSTRGTLTDNRLLDTDARHNCLTWLTTAPIGGSGEVLFKLLGMKESDLFCESHSYIVAFHEFLLNRAAKERVPFVAYWTQDSLAEGVERVKSDSDFLRRLHTTTKTLSISEPKQQIG